MNIYSSEYNIYTQRTNNIVPTDLDSRYELLDIVWDALCITLNRIQLWQQVQQQRF